MGTQKLPVEGAKRGNLWNSEPLALKVITDPEHALYNKRAIKPVTATLVKSVGTKGVLEPLICAIVDDELIVVGGRRRRLAAIQANEERVANGERPMRVPYTLVSGTIAELHSMMVVENSQREDDDFMTKAKNAQVAKRLGLTIGEIADDNGVTTTAVGQWLSLMERGCPELLLAVNDSKIQSSPALKIVTECKTHEEQRTALATLLGNGDGHKKPTGREAQAAASGKKVLPNKRMLKKLALVKQGVPKGFTLAVGWLTGQIPTNKVPGLKQVLKGLGYKE